MADSREEKIIKSMLGEQVELEPPQSRIEVLLYELKDAIEQGGGGSGGGVYRINLTMNYDTEEGSIDKTWQECKNALDSGKVLKVFQTNHEEQGEYYNDEINIYDVIAMDNNNVEPSYHLVLQYGTHMPITLSTSEPSGYPSISGGGDDTPTT